MAYPSIAKGNKRGEIAKESHPGIPLHKDVIEALIIKHRGNVSRIADAIGSQRGVVKRFIDRHPDLLESLSNCRERLIDELEEHCFDRAMNTDDTTMKIFLLKTQGRNRGYEQDDTKNSAKEIASAAFDFIVTKQQEAQRLKHKITKRSLPDIVI